MFLHRTTPKTTNCSSESLIFFNTELQHLSSISFSFEFLWGGEHLNISHAGPFPGSSVREKTGDNQEARAAKISKLNIFLRHLRWKECESLSLAAASHASPLSCFDAGVRLLSICSRGTAEKTYCLPTALQLLRLTLSPMCYTGTKGNLLICFEQHIC